MLPSVLTSLTKQMYLVWFRNIHFFEVNTHINLWIQSLKKGTLNSYKYIIIECIILELNISFLKGLTPAVKVTGSGQQTQELTKVGLSTRGTSACHIAPRTNGSTNVNKTGKRKKLMCVNVCALHTRSGSGERGQ